MSENASNKKPYVFDTDTDLPSVDTEPTDIEAITEEPETGSIFEEPEDSDQENENRENPGTLKDEAENSTPEKEKTRRPTQKTKSGLKKQGKKKRKKKKKSPLRILWLIIPLLLLAAGGYLFVQNYVILGSQVIRKDASTADLRSQSLSPEEYASAQEKLPGAEILWNVPLSGGEFSCDSQSIALSRFSDSDLDLLRYFTDLTYIDAETAELNVEQFEVLSAALPGAEIDWEVPLSGGRFSADSKKLTLTELSKDDLALIRYFSDLESVDARACRDLETVMNLKEIRPDLDIAWQVPFSGQNVPDDASELLVDDPAVSVAELEEALKYLPNVSTVNSPVNTWSMEEKDALRTAYPDIVFYWPVTVCGTVYSGGETDLDLSGRQITDSDLEEIEKYGAYLSGITHVDLRDTGISPDGALRIKNVFPNAEFTCAFNLYGKTVTSDDTFLDLTGVKVDSTEPLEAALELLPNLEKVEMTDCGIADEDMNALNKRHQNVKIVWTMYLGRSSVIRTDDTGFIGTMDHYLQFDNKTIMKLTYCEDMLCLDLGHRVPTGLKLDFLYDMPQLQYLVLADCRATDITPIGSLKNLVYLEMILSYAEDLAPLKNCENLKDLNVCFSYSTFNKKEQNFEIFTSMADHLERLWYSSLMIDPARYNELAQAMPNTEVHCIYDYTRATAEGWRYHERYYEMRDLLHMIYMGDYGGRQYSKIINGQEIPLDKEFLATQRQPDWSKIRR